jgi:hypothetical protein
MAAKLELGGTVVERRARMNQFLVDQGVKSKERKRIIDGLSRKGPEGLLRLVEDSYCKSLKELGVCSFGGDPRSILMWSHYSREHEGYCIGYDVARDPATLMQALPVEYSKIYPVVRWGGSFVGNMDFKKVPLRKYEAWAYEAERRIVDPQGARAILKVAPSAMSFVIFGYRMSRSDERGIRSLIDERKRSGKRTPVLLRAIRHSSAYALRLRSADSSHRDAVEGSLLDEPRICKDL